jgi:hypothetical protein
VQCGNRRRIRIRKLVTREETTEVEGIISKSMPHKPSAHVADKLLVIIDFRDEEIGNFQVYAHLFESQQGVENRLKSGSIQLSIDGIRKNLEVDVGRIEERSYLAEWLGIDVTGRNEDIIEVLFMRQTGYIFNIFKVSERFCIGISDCGQMILLAEPYDLFRHEMRGSHLIGKNL